MTKRGRFITLSVYAMIDSSLFHGARFAGRRREQKQHPETTPELPLLLPLPLILTL